MAQLGDRLSELREDRGLTQLQLSTILHISNSSISAYETGERAPSIDTLIAFSQYFDVTTDYLLGLNLNSISPSVLSEEIADGVTIGEAIQSLKALLPAQREAIMLVLNNMRFCAEIKGKAEQNGVRTK